MTLPAIGYGYYVTPGPDSPDPAWFGNPGWDGLMAALKAAAKAPKDGQARTVTAVRGREVTLVCTVTDGVSAWPPGRDIVPARRQPKQRKERS